MRSADASKPPAAGATGGRAPLWLIALIGLLALLTPVLVFVTDGNVAIAAAPVVGVLFVYMLWKIPLRYPMLAILFVGLIIELPGEGFASTLWESPTHFIGQLFFFHWNLVLPVPPLIFSGVDFLLMLMLPIAIYRRATHSRIDGDGLVETASPLRYFCGVTILGACLLEAWGAVQPGMEFKYSLWQFQHAIYLPVFFFLAQYAFRGPQDNVAIGKMILTAALIRAMAAVLIRTFVQPNSYEAMPTATNHSDSMLFAGALCLCVAMLVEMPSAKHFKLVGLIAPILLWGMVANNRRLVWVETGEALLVLYLMIPMSRYKRKFLRYVLMIFPVFAIYLAAGWDSQGGKLFAAARTIRSLTDAKTDRSTLWRDWENFDLISTLKTSPAIGVGYGHPYIEVIELDKIAYELEHFLPHNSVLGLWAYGGLIGFTLLWMVFAVTAFLAARCYRFATRPIDRVAALGSLMMLVIYFAHCYGDIGYGTWTSVFLLSSVLTIVGKLSLTTGAWPTKAALRPADVATG